jgi:tetratricopeptide (TPR) repeat protein
MKKNTNGLSIALMMAIAVLFSGITSAKAYNISDLNNLTFKCVENPESVDDRYNEAVYRASEEPNVYHERGEAKMTVGDCEGARKDFNRALELNPKFASSYVNKGLLDLVQTGEHPLAEIFGSREGMNTIESFSRALSLNSSYIKEYDRLVSAHPNNVNAYALRGIARYIVKDLDGSLSDFDRAIKMKPNDYLLYHYRSSVKYALEDKLGSKKDKIRSSKLFASQNQVGTRGAATATIYGSLSVPITLDPNNAKAYWHRAEANLAMYGKGREDFLRVIELQPNNPYAYYQISEILRIDGSRNESQEDIEAIAKADEYLAKAKELIVDNAEVMSLSDFDPNPDSRARIREVLGDVEGAKADRGRIKK